MTGVERRHTCPEPIAAAGSHRAASCDCSPWLSPVRGWRSRRPPRSPQTPRRLLLGVAKPDPAVFELALHRLGLPARDVLMVGDRGAWDGAAAASGITTLVLPPLQSAEDLRLHHVLDLALPR